VGTSTFLAVERGHAQWALHAKVVLSVVSSQEWTGAPPFELAEALDLEPGGQWPVMLLAAEGTILPFRALGRLVFRQLDFDLVQPVPAIVRSPRKRQVVSGVVLEERGPPLVVLDPAALLAMAKEALSS
jgi:hypothetical protein